jgi:hypothetical protein
MARRPVKPYVPGHLPAEFDAGMLDWLRREFRSISDAMNGITETRVLSNYCSLISVTQQAIADLGADWEPIVGYGDAGEARGIVIDPVAGTFNFERSGVYTLMFNGTLSHDEVNAGRTTNVRFKNITADIDGPGVQIYTGRNTGGTMISIAYQLPISLPGDSYRMEIGGGDAYATCAWERRDLSIMRVSP